MEQGDIVTLLLAAMSDKTKEERIKEIQLAETEMAARREEMRQAAEFAKAYRDEGDAKMQAATELAKATEGRMLTLHEFEDRLREINEALQNDKRSFEQIRQAVHAQQEDRAESLQKAEMAVLQRERIVQEKETELAGREEELKRAEEDHAHRAEIIRSAAAALT